MKKIFMTFSFCTFVFISLLAQKTRVYILTDISSLKNDTGEPDDTQSLIRFLLYANEFDIEGIAATYTSHAEHLYPQYIKEVIKAYGESWENLKRYGDYPPVETLLSKVKLGSGKCGIEHIGKGKDSEASEDIVHILKENHDEPLWILIWGGPLDLAQALWKIEDNFPKHKAQEMLAALRVYAISDQYDQSGQWIRDHFKSLFYILNNVTFRGLYRGGNTDLTSNSWVEKHILSNPSRLAQLYPNYNGGDPWGKVRGVKEGDTPSFLYLLSGNPEDPTSESWGGSFHRVNGTNHFIDDSKNSFPKGLESVYKWREEFQADFMKRLLWLNSK